MNSKESAVIGIASRLHATDKMAFHTLCYGLVSECPLCNEKIEK